MPVFILLETHAATWAMCNSQWAIGRADDEAVVAMLAAASQLENATPVTVTEWQLKWRALGAFWREFEEEIGPDEIEKMLAEFAEVTSCTRL
jgi:hypothetical protein